jgi:hypothetical protein
MGLLLPSTNITAKEFFITKSVKRTVDVWYESDAAIASSDVNTGTLTQMKIFDSGKHKVLETSLSGYYDDADVSALSPGFYSIQVFTTLTIYSETVYIY